MGIRTSSEERLVIWAESALGTRPSPVTAGYAIPYFSSDIAASETPVENKVLRYDPNPARPGRGRWKLQDKRITLPLERSMTGKFLRAYFGAPTTTGAADPYTHVFKRTNQALISFGAEFWNERASKGDVFDGLVVYGLEFAIDAEDGLVQVVALVTGIGAQDPATSSEEDATPVDFADSVFSKLNATIEIDDAVSDYIVSGTLRLERERSVRYIPDGNTFAKHIILGREKVSWSFTGLFDDTSEVRALATGLAAHKAELIMAHPTDVNHKLTMLSDEIDLFLTAGPGVDGGNEREITVEGVGYFASGANSSGVVGTLVNPDATVAW